MKKNIIFLSFLWCTTPLIATEDATTFHRYLCANYYHYSGKIKQAHDWYIKLFSSTNSVYTHKGYLNFLSDTKQFKQISALFPSLNKKFENDPEIQLIFTQAFEKNNQMDLADSHIIRLSQSFKTNSEITFRAAQTYIRRREPENALLTINAFLNNTPRRPNNFVFYFLKSQTYIQLNQLPEALDSTKKCLELHPQFDKGWLLCASLQEKAGNLQEALSGYATFIELSGGNSDIEKHLASLMFKYKATQNNNHALLPRAMSIENALSLFNQKRYDQALVHINSCIEQKPQDNECKLCKIQILSTMRDFNQATRVISEWFTKAPDTDLWPKTLCLLTHNGMPRQQAIKTLAHLITKNPLNPWLHIYCADLYLRDNRPKKAISFFNNALQCSVDKPLREKILYQLALTDYEKGDYPSMLSNLETAYILNPDSAHINNTLAYYWATKGKDTTKAESYITKALKSDSANPYFLDTHALILYKDKKYQEAQQILEKLVCHNNGTMLLHLAKVHYALNNKEIADTFTKKAQATVKSNPEKKALHKMQLLLTSR